MRRSFQQQFGLFCYVSNGEHLFRISHNLRSAVQKLWAIFCFVTLKIPLQCHSMSRIIADSDPLEPSSNLCVLVILAQFSRQATIFTLKYIGSSPHFKVMQHEQCSTISFRSTHGLQATVDTTSDFQFRDLEIKISSSSKVSKTHSCKKTNNKKFKSAFLPFG